MTDSLSQIRNNLWHQYRDTGSVIIFVHGVLSDSQRCWLNSKTSIFWPDLVAKDPMFDDSGVYLAGYYTAFDSTDFSIADCARELLSALIAATDRPPVLDHNRLVFICHSLGGVVTRYMLERWREKFQKQKIGLLLIASPSLGSQYPNYFDNLIQVLRHETAEQLKWKSDDLTDLDRRFKDLREQSLIPHLMGLEACEHKFPFYFHRLGLVFDWLPRVVELDSAGRYFGDPRRLPNTTHSSSVKPDSDRHCSHLLLREFYTDIQKQFPLEHWSRPVDFERFSDPRGRLVAAGNAMRCERFVWDINITEDGDAINETSYMMVSELHTGAEPYYDLGSVWVQSGQTSLQEIDQKRSSAHIVIENLKNTQRLVEQRIRLKDGATLPASFVLQSADYNVYSMNSEEFQRKETERSDNTDFLQKSIRWEQVGELIIAARFPPSMRLNTAPFVEAYQLFHGDQANFEVFDKYLTEQVKPGFHYSELLHDAILRVPKPHQWTAYRIVWQLGSQPPDGGSPKAAAALVEQSRRSLLSLRDLFASPAKSAALKTKKAKVLSILAGFGGFVVAEIQEQATKITPSASIRLDTSALDIGIMAIERAGSSEYEILRVAAGTDVSKEYWDLMLPIGDGIGGRAAKRIEPRIYDKNRGNNLYDGAYMPVGHKHHEWLLCIPLWRKAWGRAPLGVVNIGTYDKKYASFLRTLDNSESISKINKRALNEFLTELLKAL